MQGGAFGWLVRVALATTLPSAVGLLADAAKAPAWTSGDVTFRAAAIA